ncbi:hypothetical protein [Dactylosporangium sp. CA-233914]|uniref:hypothetical protein n=1 Tax=Dactylosporangium sp. CA-233914 TaxID=3239934 RepID=UPI003D90DEAE
MAAPRSWSRNRSIAARLGAVIVIAVVTVAALPAVGVRALDADRAHQPPGLGVLTRGTLEAGMAHDTLRGDVPRILPAATGDSAASGGPSTRRSSRTR